MHSDLPAHYNIASITRHSINQPKSIQVFVCWTFNGFLTCSPQGSSARRCISWVHRPLWAAPPLAWRWRLPTCENKKLRLWQHTGPSDGCQIFDHAVCVVSHLLNWSVFWVLWHPDQSQLRFLAHLTMVERVQTCDRLKRKKKKWRWLVDGCLVSSHHFCSFKQTLQ